MSYRVIIADDEPKILQLVKLLGHWDAFGIEIIDECSSGPATLASILKNHPDFVISDIKMPGMDGIELIEAARKAGSTTLFILLSGYRQFEYARSAISLNVVDYLLKPVSEEQLNATLERVCLKLKESRAISEDQEALSHMKKAQDQARQKVFWDAVFSKEEDPALRMNLADEQQCEQAYGMHFEKGCYQMMQITTNMAVNVQQRNSLFNQETERLMYRCFGEDAILYFRLSQIGYDVVLNFREEGQQKIREEVIALNTGISNLHEIYGDFTVNISTSRVKHACSELPAAMREAIAASWGKFLMMHNGILTYEQAAGLGVRGTAPFVSQEEMEKIAACVRYLRREEMTEIFERLYQKAPQIEACEPGIASSAYISLAHACASAVLPESREAVRSCFDYAFVNAKSCSQLMKMLFLQLDAYVQEEQKKLNQKARKPINEAVQFINMNYARQISQTDVADASNVSTAYLSRLFKEEMNIGFQEYLTKVRLKNAERMLAETNLSVKEIALAVGYPDEKYFSRIYKKVTGIKPSEYRKLYG